MDWVGNKEPSIEVKIVRGSNYWFAQLDREQRALVAARTGFQMRSSLPLGPTRLPPGAHQARGRLRLRQCAPAVERLVYEQGEFRWQPILAPARLSLQQQEIPLAQRQQLALEALGRCLRQFVSPDSARIGFRLDGDLPPLQRVSGYRQAQWQRRYCHMYTAKHIAAWRAVRARLGWSRSPAPLMSIGAGPRLCLMGWNFDRSWTRGTVESSDPLPWSGVLHHPEWKKAQDLLVGPVTDVGQRFVPPGEPPGQLRHMAVRPFDTGRLPESGVLLLPFVLNHLDDTDASWRAMCAWLETVIARGNRVVIMDMANDSLPQWHGLTKRLAIANGQVDFEFGPVLRRLGALYDPAHRALRTGCLSSAFCRVRVLVWNGDWRFLDG